jgi:hypothetical protein
VHQIASIQVWIGRSAKGRAIRILSVVKRAGEVPPVKHEVGTAVQVAQGGQQVLARMRISDRVAPEDDLPRVGTLLPLEAGAAVLDLLVTDVQVGIGQAANLLAAVQVPDGGQFYCTFNAINKLETLRRK